MNSSIQNISMNLSSQLMTKEQFLISVEMDIVLEYLNIYLLPTLNILGLFLNLISFFIFKCNQFKKTPIFDYLRVYTLNSSILCLFNTTFFLMVSNRFFNITYTYEMQVYICYVYKIVFPITYFYSVVLDVYISLERLFNLKLSWKKFIKISYKKVCNFICDVLYN